MSVFSFTGRIGRLEFWFTNFVVGVIAAIVAFGLSAILPGSFGILGALVAIVPAWIAGWSLTVRRLHDRDKPGGWSVIYWLVPPALSWVAGSFDTFIVSAPLSLASFALALWALIDLYFLRGTRGPNMYGADPVR